MKKIIWIVALVIIIIGVVFAAFKLKKRDSSNDYSINTNNLSYRLIENKENNEEAKEEIKETIIKDLEDGKLYTITDKEIKPDIVIGDKYFDTQITDIMKNYSNYEGKTVEIEGMFINSNPYTFVARYNTNSSACPYCTGGYSYIEYMWNGDKIELTDTTSWIKIVGEIKVLCDDTTFDEKYAYIEAESIEVMNERGKDIVNN